MSFQPRVLVVEAGEDKGWLLTHYIGRALPAAECELCRSGAEAIARLKQSPTFRAVVADHSVEQVNGLQLIKWIRAHAPNVPVIVMTEETSFEPVARDAGAAAVLSTYKFSEIGEVLRQVLDDAA